MSDFGVASSLKEQVFLRFRMADFGFRCGFGLEGIGISVFVPYF